MSQTKPQKHEVEPEMEQIKYGDVFQVHGELASRAIAPKDAVKMQTAETNVLGETQKGGPAAVMQSAAAINERRGVVRHEDITDIALEQGITVSETESSGQHIVTEAIGDQILAQYAHPGKVKWPIRHPDEQHAITIGEALVAAAHSAGDKPVDESDAAAIQAAEIRATGQHHIIPGGIAAQARSAAAHNARTMLDENKTKLAHILNSAKSMLLNDKPVTKHVAEKVVGAEIRNRREMGTYPGGVGASMAAAAMHNQGK